MTSGARPVVRGITRPKGRVRIETASSGPTTAPTGRITRPKGRVRIETSSVRNPDDDACVHHPAERPGAD